MSITQHGSSKFKPWSTSQLVTRKNNRWFAEKLYLKIEWLFVCFSLLIHTFQGDRQNCKVAATSNPGTANKNCDPENNWQFDKIFCFKSGISLLCKIFDIYLAASQSQAQLKRLTFFASPSVRFFFCKMRIHSVFQIWTWVKQLDTAKYKFELTVFGQIEQWATASPRRQLTVYSLRSNSSFKTNLQMPTFSNQKKIKRHSGCVVWVIG